MKRMRKTAGLIAGFAAVSLLCGGAVQAAEETESTAPAKPAQTQKAEEPAKAEPAKADGLREASGRVAQVDAESKTLAVKKSLMPLMKTSFAIDWRTSISAQDGRRLSLRDLKPGDPVRVEYVTLEGKHVARSITLQVPSIR